MSKEEFVRDIQHRNSVHGRQATEVGQLRKDLAAAQSQISSFKEVAGTKPEIKEAVADMSDGELTRWLEDLQSNPHKAIRQILGDNYGRRSDEDMEKMITTVFDKYINQYHDYTSEQSIQSDPDYQIHANYMKALREPEHFGNTRGARELLDFAKFANGDADKGTVDAVYEVMKLFPQVPMKDCLSMIKGRDRQAAKVDPAKIREQVKNLEGGGNAPGSKRKSAGEEIKDMEDAFAVDD